MYVLELVFKVEDGNACMCFQAHREEWLSSMRMLQQGVTDKLLEFEKGQVRTFSELAATRGEFQVALG